MILQIPIPDFKNPPVIKSLDRCINCGKPKEEMLGLNLDMGVQKKSQQVTMKIPVPMCKVCAEKERSIAKVTLIPFFVGGVIFGAIAFLPATLIAPEGPTPETAGFPFVFGGGVGLIVGIIFGTIIESIIKTLAIPVYGKLVTKRPLTIMSFLSFTDYLIGISAKFFKEKKLIQFEIENEEIAKEFKKINNLS